MKKIGILTFHRAHNYGAVLQCYALQEVLKNLGYDIEVIDYRQPVIEKLYSLFDIRVIRQHLTNPRTVAGYLKSFPRRLAGKNIYQKFDRWLRLSRECDQSNIVQDYDIYIIGSDQLWSLHCLGWMLDPIYLGEFKRPLESKVYGYAISSTSKSIEDISISTLEKYIPNFTTLSFRESVISKLVAEKCGAKSRVDIDPTLLADASVWDGMINDKWAKEKYVLLYQVRTPSNDKKLLYRKAKALAEQLNCRVIDLLAEKPLVEDFVSLFKYAQCVVTSSFHGTAFSIIFERPLQSVMLKDGHDGRYENILRAIGADELLVDMDFTPVVPTVDYKAIKARLAELQEFSMDYLRNL
ncbi:MAG: polysaccharide pyruvyl transferase family protein [Rikenellaceae bacterium]